ncbi:MAG TPA: glycosyltransferase, partial [Chthoniobacteraceae bacterium]|nr:glycosyltransferase [Chthoniobacteraceae bacterium]
MKILVVTNLYPPVHVGGYELGCRDVVEGLRRRGHEVRVLTSDWGADGEGARMEGVERILQMGEGQFAGSKWEECRKLARASRAFKPDLIYFWNQGGLCQWLPLYARWTGACSAFFLSDTNFVTWRVGAFLARAAKQS